MLSAAMPRWKKKQRRAGDGVMTSKSVVSLMAPRHDSWRVARALVVAMMMMMTRAGTRGQSHWDARSATGDDLPASGTLTMNLGEDSRASTTNWRRDRRSLPTSGWPTSTSRTNWCEWRCRTVLLLKCSDAAGRGSSATGMSPTAAPSLGSLASPLIPRPADRRRRLCGRRVTDFEWEIIRQRP